MSQRQISHFVEKAGIDYAGRGSYSRTPSQGRISHIIEKVGIDYEDRRCRKRGPGKLIDCVSYGGDGRLTGGVLLDLSASGAKVRLDEAPGDADAVDPRAGQWLKIAAAPNVPVEIVWRDGPVVGLRFLSDPSEVAGALEGLLPPEYVDFDDGAPVAG